MNPVFKQEKFTVRCCWAIPDPSLWIPSSLASKAFLGVVKSQNYKSRLRFHDKKVRLRLFNTGLNNEHFQYHIRAVMPPLVIFIKKIIVTLTLKGELVGAFFVGNGLTFPKQMSVSMSGRKWRILFPGGLNVYPILVYTDTTVL